MISVIIPAFNQKEEFLRDAIQSILNQTYKGRIQIIIVDDGSEIPIETFIKNDKIKFIRHEKNMGISEALNSGIKNASGEYICWLSSDDFFYPEKLEKQIIYLNNTGYDAVSSGYDGVFCDGNVFKRKGSQYFHSHQSQTLDALKEVLRKECIINGSTAMFKRKIFEICGLFDPEYIYCQDWDYWLNIVNVNNIYIGYIDEPLGVRREHTSNLSNELYNNDKKIKIKELEIKKMREKYGIY
jgi:glycosyltransferase involved in cell wall biosynthesis